MQRQRSSPHHTPHTPSDGPPPGDGLAQRREEINDLLEAADRIFDSIDTQDAQRYLQQNVQTGGQ